MVGITFDTNTTSLANKLIGHAENEIDKYLSKRYDISQWNTSTSVPPIITSICETLTEGYMQQRMARGGKEALTRGTTLIKQATDNLLAISLYKMDVLNSLGGVVNDMSQTAYRVLSNTDGYTPTFGEDDELKWKVDQNKLDDISDSRD